MWRTYHAPDDAGSHKTDENGRGIVYDSGVSKNPLWSCVPNTQLIETRVTGMIAAIENRTIWTRRSHMHS